MSSLFAGQSRLNGKPRTLRGATDSPVIGRIGELPRVRPAPAIKVDGDDWMRNPPRATVPVDQARARRLERIKNALNTGVYEQDMDRKLDAVAERILADLEA